MFVSQNHETISNSAVVFNRIDIAAYRRTAAAIAREAAEGIAAGARKERAALDADYTLEMKKIAIERQRL